MGVPPETVMSKLPLFPPKHETGVFVTMDDCGVPVFPMTTEKDREQDAWSVTVTVYVPAAKLEITCDEEPVFHKKVYPGVPPPAITVTDPLDALHVPLTGKKVVVMMVACVTRALVVSVQALASVTVTVYVPAINPVGSSPEKPLLQL